MKIDVTLRYLKNKRVEINMTKEAQDGCTAGELSDAVISAHEQQEDIRFTGACIVTLVNGKVVSRDHVLEDGDEMKIMPVPSGG